MPTNPISIRPTAELAGEPLADPHHLPADAANLLRADPDRRTPLRFSSDGISLAAHLYRPGGVTSSERTPALVMLGPFSSVKEQTLPHYAERLASGGYTVLTFDSRGFGESDAAPGRPRWHYDPNEIIQDYCNAVSYMLTRPDVDPERVGVVGVCMGGGYAVSVGARDKRVKAVASVAGGYDIGGTFQRFLGVDGFAAYFRKINDLVQHECETEQQDGLLPQGHRLPRGLLLRFLPGLVCRVHGLVHVRHVLSLTTGAGVGAQPSRRSLILAAFPRRLRR